MIRNKIAAAFGAAVLAGLGIGATATPASAAISDCDPGALCAWDDAWFQYTPGQVFGDNVDLHRFTKFNNAESVWNNGNVCNVMVYNGLYHTGNVFTLSRGTGISVLDDYRGGIFADNLNSNKWCV
ncbi:peptidase inhibitor family I36 protein [Streptomyces coeruleorubidus]|uniref:peptidase inhibitor family I36 protein n=1 Tax=Streptomyces coeruleorubidus TaxID=116188 RepID=UPI0033A4B497